MGVFTFSLPFVLPSNRTIVSLQGTVSYKGSCFAEALASVNVGGKKYPIKTKLSKSGGSTTVFINYSIPLVYGSGSGQIVIGNGQVCTTTMASQDRTTWEFQGLLRLQ